MFWVCTLVFQVSKPGKKCWKLGHGCRGDKKLERSKYMNVPAGRQGRHPLIHGFEHVPRLFVRWGWWSGMEAT